MKRMGWVLTAVAALIAATACMCTAKEAKKDTPLYDGKHMAYGAQEGERCFMVVYFEAGPEYDSIVQGGPVFHSDGVLEYLAGRAGPVYRVKHVPLAQ